MALCLPRCPSSQLVPLCGRHFKVFVTAMSRIFAATCRAHVGNWGIGGAVEEKAKVAGGEEGCDLAKTLLGLGCYTP